MLGVRVPPGSPLFKAFQCETRYDVYRVSLSDVANHVAKPIGLNIPFLTCSQQGHIIGYVSKDEPRQIIARPEHLRNLKESNSVADLDRARPLGRPIDAE